MKYLNNYTEKAVNKALEKYECFFAFSNEQFDMKAKKGVKYVSMGMGLICPKENVDSMIDAMNNIKEEGIKLDLKENKRRGVVLRELNNYEAFYTMDIEDTVRALKGYGISEKYIDEVFHTEIANHQDK